MIVIILIVITVIDITVIVINVIVITVIDVTGFDITGFDSSLKRFSIKLKITYLPARIIGQNSFLPKQVSLVRPYGTAMAVSDLDCAMKCTINEDLYSGFAFQLVGF